jgi:hypothetical protein
MSEDRISRIVDQITFITHARRAVDILKALPENLELDLCFDDADERNLATEEEKALAAAQIEAKWRLHYEPLAAFESLSPEERALWESYAMRNCSHLPEVPEGHVEALYLEHHGERPSIIQNLEYRASAESEDCKRSFPRFSTNWETPYLEEYDHIEEMPLARIAEMGSEPVEFSIPRDVRVYEENTAVSLSKGRAWKMRSLLIEGKVQGVEVLEKLNWEQGMDTRHISLDEQPNRLLLVEVWSDSGDDGHLRNRLRGFAVMTQVQFAEYLTELTSAGRRRRWAKSEASMIMEQFAPK